MNWIPTPQRVIDRALSHIEVVGECWHSTYSGIRGYPQIGWHQSETGKNKMRLVHRVVWEAANGPIADGMTVDHMRSVCIGPPCVRLSHLRLLPNFENARRTGGRDWPLGECAHGHPNSELRWNGKQRVCWTCKNDSARIVARNIRARQKAERLAATT